MANKVVVVGTIGNPGQTESATFSPLDRGDCVDVGALIAEQLEAINPIQTGYNEDEKKYIKQIKDKK